MKTKFSILLEYEDNGDLHSPNEEEIRKWIEHLLPKNIGLKVKEVVKHSEYDAVAIIVLNKNKETKQ